VIEVFCSDKGNVTFSSDGACNCFFCNCKCDPGFIGTTCLTFVASYILTGTAPNTRATCTRCTTERHCNSRTSTVTARDGRPSCQCACKRGFSGVSYDECDSSLRYVNEDGTSVASSKSYCSDVGDPSLANGRCKCLCKDGYSGDRCTLTLKRVKDVNMTISFLLYSSM